MGGPSGIRSIKGLTLIELGSIVVAAISQYLTELFPELFRRTKAVNFYSVFRLSSSHLLPSKVRVIPCIISKHFDGLISFHSSIVQSCVDNQPHCTPDLNRTVRKVLP